MELFQILLEMVIPFVHAAHKCQNIFGLRAICVLNDETFPLAGNDY